MTKFYQVGGSVRDKLLGLASKDIDFAVEAPSYNAMKQAILERGGRIFLETPEYFTIRAHVPKLGATDYVLCRKEGSYSDGRHPDKVEVGTIFDDLARRDFTMNAIAIDESGNVLDPFGGKKHIERGIIECVGSAEERFGEDALRMLRAIRFSITKLMVLSSEIHYELNRFDKVKMLSNISTDRIREELHKCFASSTMRTLEALEQYHLVRKIVFFNHNLWLKPTSEKV